MKNQGREYLASMGIYVFNKKVLKKMFKEDPGDDFGKDLIPNAINKGYSTLSYQYTGYWTDIGTIGSFFEANMDLTNEVPKFNMFSSSPIYTRPRMFRHLKLMVLL
jgi:glucose-1-phosphate adenylyltransferase